MPYSPNSPMPTDTISLAKWICEVLFLEPSQHQSFFESVLNHHYESLDDQDSQGFHDEMDEYMPGDRREWLAYFLASNLLADVTDKQGKPLIEHCLRVFHSCCHLSPDQRIAALLHDCVEDGKLQETGWTHVRKIEHVIGLLFGDGVSDLVVILSRPDGKSYREYIECVAGYSDAIPIKLADLRDNLDPSRGPIPDSLRQRYEDAVKVLEGAQIISDANLPPNIYEERARVVSPDQLPRPMSRCATVPIDEGSNSITLISEQEAALDSYSLSSLASIEPPYDPPDNYNLDLDLDLDYSAECGMVWDGDEFKEVG